MTGWLDSFIAVALTASLLIGLVTSYLGIFVVLRRVIFMGAALAQLASAGVALALLCGWSLVAGAGALTTLGVLIFSFEPPARRLPRDSWIAASYVFAAAAAVIFLSLAPRGEGHMKEILFGNILGVTHYELWVMAAVFVVVGVIHYLLAKEFILISFDEVTARTLGYKVTGWRVLLYFTLGAVIAVAVHAAGVLLVFSFLVFPPMIGLTLCKYWRGTVLISLLSSIVASVLGVWGSVHWDLPTGPSVVMVTALLFLAALMIRKLQGE